MALINCPECGHQMSASAGKCPNCGYKQPNRFLTKEYKNFYIGILISIIALGLFILALPIMSGFSSHGKLVLTEAEFWIGIVLIIASCIMFFFGCKLFKKHTAKTKNIFFTYVGVIVLVTVIYMCSHGVTVREDYSYSYAIESNDTPSNTLCGEYEIVDSNNDTWILILNEDETANLHVKNGREYYGTWQEYIDDMLWISFPYDDAPSALNIKGDMAMKTSLYTKDGYIYSDVTAARSKNPRMRLEITKKK